MRSADGHNESSSGIILLRNWVEISILSKKFVLTPKVVSISFRESAPCHLVLGVCRMSSHSRSLPHVLWTIYPMKYVWDFREHRGLRHFVDSTSDCYLIWCFHVYTKSKKWSLFKELIGRPWHGSGLFLSFTWCVMLCSLNLLYIDACPYFFAQVTIACSILPCFNMKLLFLCSFILW